MTNRKTTKKALIFSALSLLLCFSMLVGTTFAWFTDSVTSAGNIIQSGTLDVTMEWADGTKAVPAVDSEDWKDASAGAIFNYDTLRSATLRSQTRALLLSSTSLISLTRASRVLAKTATTS